jgi:hypothetical protein
LALVVCVAAAACGRDEGAGTVASATAGATAPPPPPPPAPEAPGSPPRDLSQLDVCGLATAAQAADAVGGAPESSTQSPDATGTGCSYTIALADGGTDHYNVWITPPEQYQILRDREDGSIEELNLGDAAYLVSEEGALPWSVHALLQDDVHLEIAGGTRQGVINLAERILNEL